MRTREREKEDDFDGRLHERNEQKKIRENEMPKARQEHQERLDGEYIYIYISK